MHVFPRGQTKDDPTRISIDAINRGLKTGLTGRPGVTLLDITGAFLDANGTISPEVIEDFVHLTTRGYRIWAENMEPTLSKLLAGVKG